jgi:hypothetical protein
LKANPGAFHLVLFLFLTFLYGPFFVFFSGESGIKCQRVWPGMDHRWLKVDKAIIFYISSSPKAETPAIIIGL